MDGLGRGVQAAIKCLNIRTRAGAKTPSQALPVELVYQGGDDLLCLLPHALLGAFLDGFSKPKLIPAARTFTGAAIIVPDDLAGQGPKIPFLAARLVPEALEWAKHKSRGLPTGKLERKLRQEASRFGFHLIFPVEPERHGTQVSVWMLCLNLDQKSESQ